MEEKKKKRYFCDFWRKLESSSNNVLEIAGLIVFLLSEAIIYVAGYNVCEEPDMYMALIGGLAITVIFEMIVIPAGIVASKISQKHKEQDREKDK